MTTSNSSPPVGLAGLPAGPRGRVDGGGDAQLGALARRSGRGSISVTAAFRPTAAIADSRPIGPPPSTATRSLGSMTPARTAA